MSGRAGGNPVHFLIGCSMQAAAIPDHFRCVAGCLLERGHRVTLMTWGKDVREHFGVDGAVLLRFPSTRPTGLRDIRFAYRVLKEGRVDCAVANFGSVNALGVASVLARVPVRVAWYHTRLGQIMRDSGGYKVVLFLRIVRKRLAYALFTQLAANSAASAEELRRSWRIRDGKVSVRVFGIEDPSTKVRVAERRAERIVCPGRLDYSKGQDLLLEALPRVAQCAPGVEAHFFGDGTERERLMALARANGAIDRVHFHGAVARGRLLSEMAEAAVVVVPSRDEAFGLVNIEAMAMGTPVVASRVGGIPEIVRDGVDGLLFEPGNAEELAACLLRLLGDAELRAVMGWNARQRFLEKFESSRVAKKQADWLEGLVREARGEE